ncbi:cytochrome P450 [Amylocystis lapponica]|nr:cytochrome P450 [Amylocystis lapponica]
MSILVPLFTLGVIVAIYYIYHVFTWVSVADIPGPKPDSFWLGNLPQLLQEEATTADMAWQKEFGGIARIKAPLGEDMLWLSDPKALQYIYQTSGYNFPKQPERRILSRVIGDYGLTWSEGETHKRFRKVMLPAFGGPEARALLPIFTHYAEQITIKWRDILTSLPNQSSTFNIPLWIAPATLDAIGEAAFDYKFGALESSDNELGRAYANLFAGIFSSPTKLTLFLQSVAHYVPMPILELLYDYLPGKGLDKARDNHRVAFKVAEELLASKSQDLLLGRGNRDIMSILVGANASEDKKAQLTHYEMCSQMRTIMLAGQETTANTLSWALMELANHPDCQARLRTELRAREKVVRDRGETYFTAPDLEAMPYLQAVLREVLRLYPAIYHNFRQSIRADVLPLSKPITTLSGKVITEVPIREGLRLVLSVSAYNRNKDLWGEDADEFNPERWLKSKGPRGPTVGVWSNLLSFAGGVRACIGWRFALYELQAFIAEMVANFEFLPTEDFKRIRRENTIVMVPTLEGEVEKGVSLPMRVSMAPRD